MSFKVFLQRLGLGDVPTDANPPLLLCWSTNRKRARDLVSPLIADYSAKTNRTAPPERRSSGSTNDAFTGHVSAGPSHALQVHPKLSNILLYNCIIFGSAEARRTAAHPDRKNELASHRCLPGWCFFPYYQSLTFERMAFSLWASLTMCLESSVLCCLPLLCFSKLSPSHPSMGWH